MSHAQTIGRGHGTAFQTPAVGTAAADRAVRVPTVLLIVFMLCMLPPIYFYVGELRLSPSRLVTMVLFIPMLLRLLAGGAGRIQTMDVLMLFWGFWIILTLVVNHGMERFPLASITAVELVGGYLIGRILIRSAAAYRTFIKLLLWSLILIAPAALVELLTNYNPIQEMFRGFVPTYVKAWSSYGRMGMERVMAGFAHPILFGLYCSMAIASAYLLFQGFFKRALVLVFTVAMTFASLSSAPLIAAAVQIGLLIWGKVTGGRWWLLAGITAFCYVTIDMLSNRTPITILINYITFDPATAWTRVNIYTFGIQEVWANPIMGIGLNDWRRPYWLTGSVDNFWLLMAMRHGVLGFVLIFVGMLLHCRAIWRAEIPSETIRRYRTGYLITTISQFLTLCTVHIWGEVSVFVFFFLGAGAWFVDAAGKEGVDGEAAPAGHAAGRPPQARPAPAGAAPAKAERPSARPQARPPSRYTRF